MLYVYPPRGIRALQDDRPKPFCEVIRILMECCQRHDPRDKGICGYTGLCRKLFDARETAWEWGRSSYPPKFPKAATTKPVRDSGAWLRATLGRP